MAAAIVYLNYSSKNRFRINMKFKSSRALRSYYECVCTSRSLAFPFCMNNPLKQCQPHKMIIVIYYYHKIEQARNEANDVNMKIWLKGSIPFNRICSSHQNVYSHLAHIYAPNSREMYNHNNVTLFANVVLEPFFTPFLLPNARIWAAARAFLQNVP